MICRCGCNEEVPKAGAGRPRVWIEGHKKPPEPVVKICACGCGEQVVRVAARGRLPKFLPGHPLGVESVESGG